MLEITKNENNCVYYGNLSKKNHYKLIHDYIVIN